MNRKAREELAARKAAAEHPERWDGVEDWVERAYYLVRPGGTLSLVLPDGKPFIVPKDRGSIR